MTGGDRMTTTHLVGASFHVGIRADGLLTKWSFCELNKDGTLGPKAVSRTNASILLCAWCGVWVNLVSHKDVLRRTGSLEVHDGG